MRWRINVLLGRMSACYPRAGEPPNSTLRGSIASVASVMLTRNTLANLAR
jgi:hypothetical protein